MPRLLKTEQPHHQKAFERYNALGERRTYTQLASALDVDISTIKLWGRSFDWQGRIRSRDLEEARQTADQTSNAHVDDRRRRRKLIDLALFKIAKAIAEDKVRYQASDLERIIGLMEKLDAAPMWTNGAPRNDPHEIVEYLRSLLTCNLEKGLPHHQGPVGPGLPRVLREAPASGVRDLIQGEQMLHLGGAGGGAG